jgi:ribosomal protein S27E
LTCGRLERGFIRAKCTGCRHEHRVAFSCKRRGWCPSCASRRMAESGAHLVDNVLPKAPHWSTRGPVGIIVSVAPTHAVRGAAPMA